MLHVVVVTGCGQTGGTGRHWLTDGGTGTAKSLFLTCKGDRCGAALLGGTSQVTGARASSEEVVADVGPSVWRLWRGRGRGTGISGPGDSGAETAVQGTAWASHGAESLTQVQWLHFVPETTENWVMAYVRRGCAESLILRDHGTCSVGRELQGPAEARGPVRRHLE